MSKLLKDCFKAAKLVGEIQSLAYMISNTTDHDVFVDYSGHTNSLETRIYVGGWEDGKKVSIQFHLYLDLDLDLDLYSDSDDATEKLKEIRNKLSIILHDEYVFDIEKEEGETGEDALTKASV